jgi:hypothetical protein
MIIMSHKSVIVQGTAGHTLQKRGVRLAVVCPDVYSTKLQ